MANERPRHFTAEQARDFLSQLLEDQPSDNVTSSDSDWSGEEENDRSRSRSRSSSTGSHRSHPSPGRYCLISTIYTPNQRNFSMHEGNGYKII